MLGVCLELVASVHKRRKGHVLKIEIGCLDVTMGLQREL